MSARLIPLALVLFLCFPAGTGSAILTGTKDAETIVGTPQTDWINGRGGGDVLRGKGSNDTIIGLSGNDDIAGNWGADYLYGGDGNDILRATGHDGKVDHLDGGRGTDTCIFRGAVTLVSCENPIRLS